ncbi:MAG: serine hydroxymethyltransferase, partial [Bacillota bacterium]
GFRLVSGGTDNHLMLLDLRGKGINGKQAENLLDDVGITVNKNTIPYDTESPFVTSGIRVGTPAVTTRGMKEEAMEEISDIITLILNNPNARKEAAERVEGLCARYPLYQEIRV